MIVTRNVSHMQKTCRRILLLSTPAARFGVRDCYAFWPRRRRQEAKRGDEKNIILIWCASGLSELYVALVFLPFLRCPTGKCHTSIMNAVCLVSSRPSNTSNQHTRPTILHKTSKRTSNVRSGCDVDGKTKEKIKQTFPFSSSLSPSRPLFRWLSSRFRACKLHAFVFQIQITSIQTKWQNKM